MNAPNLKFLKKHHEQLFKNLIQIAKKYSGAELNNKINLLFNYYDNIGKDDSLEDISINDLRKEVFQASNELHTGTTEETLKVTGRDLEEKIKKLYRHGNYAWLGNYRIDDMKASLKNKYQSELNSLKKFNNPEDLSPDLKELMLDTFHSCYLLNTETKRQLNEREQRFIRPLTDTMSIRDSTVMDELLSKRISTSLFSRMLKALDEEAELEDKMQDLQQKQEKNKKEQEDLQQKQQELENKQKELEDQKQNAQSQSEKKQLQKQQDNLKQDQQDNQQQQEQSKQEEKKLQQQSDQAGQQLDQQKQKNDGQMKQFIVQASQEAKNGKEIKTMLQMSMPGGLQAGTEAMINEVREDFLDRNMLDKINMKEFMKLIKSTKFFDSEINDFKNDVFGTTAGITIGDNMREVIVDELLTDDWQFYQNYVESNLLQYEMKANTIPNDYLVLIDNSGSMSDTKKTTMSRAVAYWLMLKTIREKGNVYLWFFNAMPEGSRPISFKDDKKGFLVTLFGTTCNGGTNISSILEAAAEFFKNEPVFKEKRNKEVVLISDHESSIDRRVLEKKNYKLNAVLVGARGSALKTIQEFTEKHKIFALDEAKNLLKALKD